VTLVSFGGLSVPAGTPDRLVIRLNEVLNRALERPEVRAKVESLGGAIAPSTPEQYVEDLKAEIALTERMMRAAKLEPQ
jgi:tripartite-type tricarboxylate transporter receptor subunit TctC